LPSQITTANLHQFNDIRKKKISFLLSGALRHVIWHNVPNQGGPMRAAIYLYVASDEAQVSSDRKIALADTTIVTSQLQKMQDFARSQEWKIVKIYREEPNRQFIFSQMIAEAESGHFDVLCFWSLDRLSRRGAIHTICTLNHLQDSGVQYLSFTEPFFNSTDPDPQKNKSFHVVSILTALEHQESVWYSERTRLGLQRQMLSGRPGPNGHKGPGHPPADIDLERAKTLHSKGLSYNNIAATIGAAKSTVMRRLKQADNGRK
jgi:DNA invertase Pin-like site-specific DNA recombinase